MLTTTTQAAIAILKEIYEGGSDNTYDLHRKEKIALLNKLTAARLIYLIDKEKPQSLAAYRSIRRKAADISLLDILEAMGEGLDCSPITEEFYMHYGKAARKLGVINQVTRICLQGIKLYDI